MGHEPNSDEKENNVLRRMEKLGKVGSAGIYSKGVHEFESDSTISTWFALPHPLELSEVLDENMRFQNDDENATWLHFYKSSSTAASIPGMAEEGIVGAVGHRCSWRPVMSEVVLASKDGIDGIAVEEVVGELYAALLKTIQDESPVPLEIDRMGL